MKFLQFRILISTEKKETHTVIWAYTRDEEIARAIASKISDHIASGYDYAVSDTTTFPRVQIIEHVETVISSWPFK